MCLWPVLGKITQLSWQPKYSMSIQTSLPELFRLSKNRRQDKTRICRLLTLSFRFWSKASVSLWHHPSLPPFLLSLTTLPLLSVLRVVLRVSFVTVCHWERRRVFSPSGGVADCAASHHVKYRKIGWSYVIFAHEFCAVFGEFFSITWTAARSGQFFLFFIRLWWSECCGH